VAFFEGFLRRPALTSTSACAMGSSIRRAVRSGGSLPRPRAPGTARSWPAQPSRPRTVGRKCLSLFPALLGPQRSLKCSPSMRKRPDFPRVPVCISIQDPFGVTGIPTSAAASARTPLGLWIHPPPRASSRGHCPCSQKPERVAFPPERKDIPPGEPVWHSVLLRAWTDEAFLESAVQCWG
jgi:hypothetical protein